MAVAFGLIIGFMGAHVLRVKERLTAEHKAWHEVARAQALDVSFMVDGWKAVKWTRHGVGLGGMKLELRGNFASDSSGQLVLMNQENFDRLRGGYPPVPIATFGPGPVSIKDPPDPTWFVFFQQSPAKDKTPFPTTGLQLGLLALRSLQEANQPPAHVTGEFDLIVSVYTSQDEAAALRARFSEVPQPAAEKPAPPADTSIFGNAIEVKPPTN